MNFKFNQRGLEMKRIFIGVMLSLFLVSASIASDAQFRSCQAKLEKAQQIELLADIELRTGRVDVTVGPTFYDIPFHAKTGFAETLNCFLNAGETGSKKACNEIRFIDWRSGNAIGKYSRCKLVLRRQP